MQSTFEPTLATANWNEEWVRLQESRHRADSAGFWDERAKTFTTKDSPNAYVDDFLKLAGIRPGETVFDMGCGTGALAIPLAKMGCPVTAADFSQGMLDALAENRRQLGATGITPLRMGWQDDWSAFGVTANSADVCVASRSMAVADMRDALLRLTGVARRRVCMTLATGASPRTDERILRAIGLKPRFGNDHQYAFNILLNEGLQPEVNYIRSERHDTFATCEEAFETFRRMVNDSTDPGTTPTEREAALKRLREWLQVNLAENPHAGEPDKKGLPQKALRLRKPRVVTWAFMGWNA